MTVTPNMLPRSAGLHDHRFVDDWLLLEGEFVGTAMHRDSQPPSPEILLSWNASLAGGAKFVLSSERRICLRAELPWAEDRDSPDAAEAVAAGFAEAQRLWQQDKVPMDAAPLPSSAAVPAQLIQAFAESSWGSNTRADDTLVADLDVAGGRWQAQLFPLLPNSTLALVEVASIEAGAKVPREAIALMLLLAGGALRWVRPAFRANGDRCVAVFEVLFTTDPSPADIVDALCGLSLACRMCAAEANALLDESAAQQYLQVLSPLPVHNRNRQKQKEISWSN